ncbi:LysR family transcriptional regulator [Paenibacillus roseipurpureus]|uniref:LysR family transcriptional regulator n=1 Tax=Paenibacillus roseopurpureus TaxID=2918901 RepID=A0AA96LU67_9BACL|nr:LysR family transcriptional regulator [Paenibacillus sp. MBLB1832]WNR46556.1 LysR family transcriptional regulator [Paenibacillus sp. MBLB1832]
MDLTLYKTLLEVAKWQNFTKASEKLGYAQSSVTSQIQKLELEYGVEIFERIDKKMRPTPAGEILLRYAAKMMKMFEESKINVAGQTTGSFMIGTHETTLFSYMLPPFLGAFKKNFPNITISINELLENDTTRALKAGECDLGFIVDREMNDPDLIFRTIQEEEFVIVAAPDHPLAVHGAIVPEDLNGAEILMSISGGRCRKLFETMLRKHNVQYTLTYEINNYETIKKCAMHGLGICLLPRTTVTSEIKNGQLTILPLSYPHFKLSVQLCYHAKRQLSVPMNNFIHLMCATTPHEQPYLEQASKVLPL